MNGAKIELRARVERLTEPQMGKNRERMGRIDPIPGSEIETERVYTQEKDRYR